MIVIADTSPLHYLILAEVAEVLPKLFGRVAIPEEVHPELLHERTPEAVRAWVAKRPEWLEVATVDWSLVKVRPALDVGEAAAIVMAEQMGLDSYLLMDDMKGRREAAKRHLQSTGTLGVLRAGSLAGVLRLHSVLPRLLETNFYAPEELITALLSDEKAREAS